LRWKIKIFFGVAKTGQMTY